MNWTQMPLGPLQTNAYILSNDHGKAIVFDPGGNGDSLVSWLKKQNLQPLAILLTHAHFDHIGGIEELRAEWGIDVYLHEKERGWLPDASMNGSAFFLGNNEVTVKEADKFLTGQSTLEIEDFTFELFETPGHSPGSVSFYHKESETVFSGDALFQGSIGRTDLPGGNHEQLLKSIHDKLLSLPEDTKVACGHGPITTIGQEMDSNPFLSGF